jgi:hypothetical protein
MRSVTNWFKTLLSSEHRKAQRLKSPLLVAYYWDGSVPTAHEIQDISSTGFYLLTKERWYPGTILTMTLQRASGAHVKPGEENNISVLSKVVRLGNDGVGFDFMPLETEADGLKSRPAGKKAINRFVEQIKADRSHAVLEHFEAVLKSKLSRRNSGSAIPGEPWREPHEEPEG